MKKIGGVLVLILCFCGARLGAQEAVSGGWSSGETKQGASRSVPIAMTMKEHAPASLTSAVVPKVRSMEKKVQTSLPFPTSTPVRIDYPRKAVRKGWEGQAVVAAEILPDGTVGRTALAKSSGHEVLDHAAQDGIKSWKFETESGDKETVPLYVDIPVTFMLENRGEN